MGNCRSCETSSSQTAKVILQDGELREFAWPVKVSLLSPENSDCFICSSDEMEFGRFLAAMGGEAVLQPGEIYFELPMAWRNQRMQAEDMAALAYKASAALARNGGDGDDDGTAVSCGCCGSRKVEPVMLFSEKERPLLAAEGGDARRDGGAGGWRRRRFVAELNAIVEE